MLTITIPSIELYDENTNEFYTYKGQTLHLEHSLVSLSKWESKWCKPFLSKEDKTVEESVDYIKCMTITQNVHEDIYKRITPEIIRQVSEYIAAPMSATTFNNFSNQRPSKEVVTSELIYYWMVAMTIPFECQKWHLNRLLTLINICNIKNQPAKKMSKAELIARNRALNEERRNSLKTKG